MAEDSTASVEQKRKALASHQSNTGRELKETQQREESRSIDTLQREGMIFMLLVGGNLCFLAYAFIFVSDTEAATRLIGWAIKGFALYPAYLVLRLVMKFMPKK